MFKYPWGNLQGLNLAWFLEQFNQLLEDWATAEAGIAGSLDDEIQRAEDALSDVFDARDAAAASATAAAGSASSAGTSATAAQNSATAAAGSATLANNKAAAAGTSEANAAQSASQAAGSATQAANSATSANQKATEAANSATTAGQQATNAAGSATAAANSATAAANSAQSVEDENLIAEGFAVGEQNGVPVIAGPYYQNNAKYYASLLGNVRPTMGDTVLDEIMPTNQISTSYSGRTVTRMGRRVSIARTASGSTYRRHVLNGEFTTTFSDGATPEEIYQSGGFSTIRRIGRATKISLNMWGDIGNTICSTTNLYIYTTGDGGTTIHAAGFSNTAIEFNPEMTSTIPLSEDMLADLNNATPEICIVLTTRSGYETVRGTMTATISLEIS